MSAFDRFIIGSWYSIWSRLLLLLLIILIVPVLRLIIVVLIHSVHVVVHVVAVVAAVVAHIVATATSKILKVALILHTSSSTEVLVAATSCPWPSSI